jgi:hypothetical protein
MYPESVQGRQERKALYLLLVQGSGNIRFQPTAGAGLPAKTSPEKWQVRGLARSCRKNTVSLFSLDGYLHEPCVLAVN